MDQVLVVLVVVVALAFGVLNGLHDASDVIATPIVTGAVSAGSALLVAAALNLLGGLLGSRVAQTIGFGVVDPPVGGAGLQLVLAALVGAIAWNLLTWRLGVPSSSTHALVGGLAGAGLALGDAVRWSVLLSRVVLPLVLSPLVGFLVAAALTVGISWALRHAAPGRAHRRFRYAQVLSSAAVAVGHGLQDAQRTAGVVLLALVTAGALPRGSALPLWVAALAALALAAGTAAGGWRIVRTLGCRITGIDPPSGFAAEATTAGLLTLSAAGLGVPVSTTHTITAAVTGAGSVRGRSGVRRRVLRRVVGLWVLTAPASALVAAAVALLMPAAPG